MPMDLIKLSRSRIQTEVFEHGNSKEWRVFISNQTTTLLLSPLFSQSDILNYNFILSLKLEDPQNEKINYPAVYFVDLDKIAYKNILKNISDKNYTYYNVMCIKTTEYAEKLKKIPNVNLKIVEFGFMPIAERVFTFDNTVKDAIKSVEILLRKRFAMHFIAECKTLAQEIYIEGEKNADLVLLSRSVDAQTPLIHFFGFQSILSDFGIGEVFPDDPLWKKIRHVHIAEINKTLAKESNEILESSRALKEDVNTKALMRLVLSAPERIQTKESLEKFLDYTDQIFENYDENLQSVVTIEQNLATGFDQNKRRYKNASVDVFKIFTNSNIKKCDKLRLFLLYSLNHNFTSAEKDILSSQGILNKDEINLDSKIKEIKYVWRKQECKYKYVTSRYEPILSEILKNLVEGKSKLERLGKRRDSNLSLRKSNFIFDSKIRNIILVIFTDFVTYPEIEVVYEMSKIMSVDIIVGAPKVLTPNDFIEELKKK